MAPFNYLLRRVMNLVNGKLGHLIKVCYRLLTGPSHCYGS